MKFTKVTQSLNVARNDQIFSLLRHSGATDEFILGMLSEYDPADSQAGIYTKAIKEGIYPNHYSPAATQFGRATIHFIGRDEAIIKIGFTEIARLYNHPVIMGEPVDHMGITWYVGASPSLAMREDSLAALARFGKYVFYVATWVGYKA